MIVCRTDLEVLVLKINPKRISTRKIELAAELLKEGKLVAFPTETVYGLGASVFQRRAMERVYEVKGRGERKPLTVHIATEKAIDGFAREITPKARKLVSAFWPGPLTLVLPKKEDVPPEISRSDKVGLRMPDHPIALALIERSGPLVAPSANLSGHPSPTTPQMVKEQLDDRIDCLIDGGRTPLGIESTVVELADKPRILRRGMISEEDIEEILEEKVEVSEVREEGIFPARVILVEREEMEEAIRRMDEVREKEGKKVGVIATREIYRLLPKGWRKASWGSSEDLLGMARKFFYLLDRMKDVDILLVENPPALGIGKALRSRLEKLAKETPRADG